MSNFSFYGRARRTSYGIFVLITVAAYFAIGSVLFAWMVKTDQNQILEKMQRTDPNSAHAFDLFTKIPLTVIYGGMLACAVMVLVLYVAWICISVRRLHDMNASGWFVLLFALIALFPYLGYILVSLVLGFWPGSCGRNRFGADPRLPLEIANVFDGGRVQQLSPSLR